MNEITLTEIIECPNPNCEMILTCEGTSKEKIKIICPICNNNIFFQFHDIKKEKIKNLITAQIPYLLVILSILISYFIFQTINLAILLSFIILIPFFVFFKFDVRIPIIYALLMLMLSSGLIFFNKNESFANQFAIYAYWLLIVGIICTLIEFLKQLRTSNIKKRSA